MAIIPINISSPATDAACVAFPITHGLGFTPSSLPEIVMKELGLIAWLSPFYDDVNFYFQASGPSLDAVVKVYT
jgi:hypothetical protein